MSLQTQTKIYSFIVGGVNPEFARRAEVIDLKTSERQAAKGLSQKDQIAFMKYLAYCKRIGFYAQQAIDQAFRTKQEFELVDWVGKYKDELTGAKYEYRLHPSKDFANNMFDVRFVRVYFKPVKK